MSREEGIRYFIEHQLTRDWFFKEGRQFTAVLAEKGDIYPALVRQVYHENGIECPYTDDMFAVVPLHLKDDIYCLSIVMPQPEREGDCLQILMIFDGEFSRRAYFTIEYGESIVSDQKLTWCCEWNEQNEHLNHGQCTPDPLECIRKCYDIFTGSETEAEE